MNSFVIFMIVGVAIAHGKTNGEVKNCMTQAMTGCKDQCLPKIADQTIRDNMKNCFAQAEPQLAQKLAAMEQCLEGKFSGILSQNCFKMPSNDMGHQENGNPAPVTDVRLAPFFQCSHDCMKSSVNSCSDGCTAEMPVSLKWAFMACKNAGTPNQDRSSMERCTRAALGN